jgi:Inhibitor of growth proteins N-terminal histone-binding
MDELRVLYQKFIDQAEEKVLQLEVAPLVDANSSSGETLQGLPDRGEQNQIKFGVRAVPGSQEIIVPTAMELFQFVTSTSQSDQGDGGTSKSAESAREHGEGTATSAVGKRASRTNAGPATAGVLSVDSKSLESDGTPLMKKHQQGRSLRRSAKRKPLDDDQLATRGSRSNSTDWEADRPPRQQGDDDEDNNVATDESANLYASILSLQKECLQFSDEKVVVAQQVYDLIDGTVQRLDRDLWEMEKMLRSSGSFVPPNPQAIWDHPTIGGSAVGAAASTSMHIPHSGTMTPTGFTAAGSFGDGPSTAVVGAIGPPATETLIGLSVACQVDPASEWILAKVLHFDPSTRIYNLADDDPDSNKGTPRVKDAKHSPTVSHIAMLHFTA